MIIASAASTAPTTRDQVVQLRTQLASTLPGLVGGANILRAADVSGEDWQAQLQAATRESGAAWRAPYDTLTQVKAGVAQLGSDPLAGAAREVIGSALVVADRGLDNMGRAYMQFWSSPEQRYASALTTFVAGQSDRTSAAIAQAISSLDELLAAAPAR